MHSAVAGAPLIKRCTLKRTSSQVWGFTLARSTSSSGKHEVYIAHLEQPLGIAYLNGLRKGDEIHTINGTDWRQYSEADIQRNLSQSNSVLSLDLTYSRPFTTVSHGSNSSAIHSNITSHNTKVSEIINLVDSDDDSLNDSDMVDCLMDISNRTIDVDLDNRTRHHSRPQQSSSNVGRSIISNGQWIIDLVSDDEETDLPLPPSNVLSSHLPPRPPSNPLKRLCEDAIDASTTKPPVVLGETAAVFKKRKIIVKGIEIKLEFEPKLFGEADDHMGEVIEVRGGGDGDGKLHPALPILYTHDANHPYITSHINVSISIYLSIYQVRSQAVLKLQQLMGLTPLRWPKDTTPMMTSYVWAAT